MDARERYSLPVTIFSFFPFNAGGRGYVFQIRTVLWNPGKANDSVKERPKSKKIESPKVKFLESHAVDKLLRFILKRTKGSNHKGFLFFTF